MTIAAEVSSTRSVFEDDKPIKRERPESGLALTVSIGAEPPLSAAASNLVIRTVINLILSLDCILAKALPA